MDKCEELLNSWDNKAEKLKIQLHLVDNNMLKDLKEHDAFKQNDGFNNVYSKYNLMQAESDISLGEYFNDETAHIESQIKELKGIVEGLEMKNKTYSTDFHKFAEELCDEYNKDSVNFEPDNINKNIKKFNEQAESSRGEIDRLSRELEELKKGATATELVPLDAFSLNKVTSEIKIASLTHFGDPDTLQKQLKKIKNNIELHKTKIENIQQNN